MIGILDGMLLAQRESITFWPAYILGFGHPNVTGHDDRSVSEANAVIISILEPQQSYVFT